MKIAFIGGGNMAAALIAGLAGKLAPGGNIHVVDPNPAALDKLFTAHGVSAATELDERVPAAEVIVLAVKPQSMREVASQLKPLLELAQEAGRQPLLLSIAAGIRSADLARWLGGYAAIVRTMPNTPALIGQGVTGMVAASGVTAQQRDAADHIMRAVGATVWVDKEELIDPVTAVSGSGPAYVFYFIEAMQAAAEELGLTAAQGRELALATFAGAAQLALQSDEPVSVLRERVTSKGGTTYAALSSMEQSGVKAAIGAAMRAAAARGKQLGEELGTQD
ncbi:pyrroline-5-carboxylate reductase [Massilia sp. YIM B04103]|uniref:pyrroline-5-carboxylate reductase n=1 Tax=Massilia sp. YIM B04103 TaxID=2963106 RepID=UPI00210922C2|nr:pyrroline-5-carboxylate reductase [Massilia sp. YIM B04103]